MLRVQSGHKFKDMRALLLLFVQVHKPIRNTRMIKGTVKGKYGKDIVIKNDHSFVAESEGNCKQ